MPLHPRPPTLGPKTKVALGLLAAFVLLGVLFDWNWFRPALERHLSQTSRREVRAADLHLSLDAALQPVVRLRGVHVENTSWADAGRPFVEAGELRFTFGWKTLFSDMREITHLVLIDADIDLERQADGLRNWRLTRPDDRGPGRFRVLALEAHNSRLRVVHQGVNLVLQTSATSLPQPEGPLTQRVEFSGRFRDAPFSGDTLTGPVLTLQQTGRFFALRGQAHTGQTVLQMNGKVADLLKLGGIDAQVQLDGPSLAQLKPFFPDPPWPATKPYRAQAQLARHGDNFDAAGLRITLGSSDVAGDVAYHAEKERTTVQATLRSEQLSAADLPSLSRAGTPPTQRVLPQGTLPLEQLRHMDGQVDWAIQSLQVHPLPTLQGLRARASLDHDSLQLALQGAEVAGGQLNGQFALDARPHTPTVRLEAHARGLRLEQLLPRRPETAQLEAPLNAHLKLSGHGHSVAAWAGSAEGQASVALGSGSVGKRLAAKLSLDLGKLFGALFEGDGAVPIHCGAVAIDFKNGTGSTRLLRLDTETSHVDGQGSLHLTDEAWAVVLTPQKHSLTLGSVLVQGNFRGFSQKLVERQPIAKAEGGPCAASCAATGCG
ncbi:MAG TPA: AsmA family protein [Rhizobacter sp.]|nr:AsmA family protein [Rhizobacter sp.]